MDIQYSNIQIRFPDNSQKHNKLQRKLRNEDDLVFNCFENNFHMYIIYIDYIQLHFSQFHDKI